MLIINLLQIGQKVEKMIKKTYYPTPRVESVHEEYVGETLGQRIRTIIETGIPSSEVSPLTYDDNTDKNDVVDPAANVKTDWFEMQEASAYAEQADKAAHDRAAAAEQAKQIEIDNKAAAVESGAE